MLVAVGVLLLTGSVSAAGPVVSKMALRVQKSDDVLMRSVKQNQRLSLHLVNALWWHKTDSYSELAETADKAKNFYEDCTSFYNSAMIHSMRNVEEEKKLDYLLDARMDAVFGSAFCAGDVDAEADLSFVMSYDLERYIFGKTLEDVTSLRRFLGEYSNMLGTVKDIIKDYEFAYANKKSLESFIPWERLAVYYEVTGNKKQVRHCKRMAARYAQNDSHEASNEEFVRLLKEKLSA